MDTHSIIETLLAIVAFFGGMFVKGLNDSVKSLHAQDAALSDKVHSMETLVVGEYVKRAELSSWGDAIFKKLDRIENKLDGKADK
jgi:hypothetical protein